MRDPSYSFWDPCYSFCAREGRVLFRDTGGFATYVFLIRPRRAFRLWLQLTVAIVQSIWQQQKQRIGHQRP